MTATFSSVFSSASPVIGKIAKPTPGGAGFLAAGVAAGGLFVFASVASAQGPTDGSAAGIPKAPANEALSAKDGRSRRGEVAVPQGRQVILISTVLASNESDRAFDPRLEHIRSELKRLRFKSYQLVASEARRALSGDACGMDLPGGRYLQVTTRERTADHLLINILLNEQNRPVINTDVKLDHDSVVLLGGPKSHGGTLLISIQSEEEQVASAVLNR